MTGEQTAAQVKEMAEKSGCDLGKALAIADEETRQLSNRAKTGIDTEPGNWDNHGSLESTTVKT